MAVDYACTLTHNRSRFIVLCTDGAVIGYPTINESCVYFTPEIAVSEVGRNESVKSVLFRV